MALPLERRIQPSTATEAIGQSLRELARRAAEGRIDPRVRTWAVAQCMKAGNPEGPGARARVLFDAIRRDHQWIPDPVDCEWMQSAYVTLGAHDSPAEGPTTGDCDDLTIVYLAAVESVGVRAAIVSHAYDASGAIAHVLGAIHDGARWWYVDPSATPHRKSSRFGECEPFTREQWAGIPNAEIICDADVCLSPDGTGISPLATAYADGHGDFVGLGGVPAKTLAGCPPPASTSKQDLEAYALCAGAEAAADWLTDATGIDAHKFLKNGQFDAGGAALAAADYYTGIDVSGFLNPDGTVRWESIAGDIGGVCGAAVCAAFGAGAVAPLCSFAGTLIGKACYAAAKAFAEGFGDLFASGKLPQGSIFPTTPWQATLKYAQAYESTGTVRLFAIRALALASYAPLRRLQKARNAALKISATLDQTEAALVRAGWSPPPGWRTLGGSIFSGGLGDLSNGNPTVFDLAFQAAQLDYGTAKDPYGLKPVELLKPLDYEYGQFWPGACRVYMAPPPDKLGSAPGFDTRRDFMSVAEADQWIAQDLAHWQSQNRSRQYQKVLTDPRLEAWLAKVNDPGFNWQAYSFGYTLGLQLATTKFLAQVGYQRAHPLAAELSAPPAKDTGLPWWVWALGLGGAGYGVYRWREAHR